MYDIAIIGTGPAGISAAITATARNKQILLLGSRALSDKIEKAHLIMNYPGLPAVSGEELSEAFNKHLISMGIAVTEDRANAVYAMGEYFAIQGHSGNYEARTVILAAGISAKKPYPGELENLGRGVSYCATCDAALYRGRTALVIAESEAEEAEAIFLSEIADKVTYIPLYEGCAIESSKIEIRKIIPTEIVRDADKMWITSGENRLSGDGVFVLRSQVAPATLVPGIELDGNYVKVDRRMKTNLPGLFACGDITGGPAQYVKAAGEGNVAVLSAVSFLASGS